MTTLDQIGVVIIGRNEGDRLLRCFDSLMSETRQIVYVDSGSTDESVRSARALGIDVVSLDMNIPFTAARARNEGFKRMRTLYSHAVYVQFVDGDCEIAHDWLPDAFGFLEKNPNVAIVCGRRREKFPERTVYNMLCDIEWNTPIGETKACGGDALMRVDAFEGVQGFRPDLIAGEEPELCVRLRAAGWKIWRIDHEMTLHDAAMTHFSQWWKRTLRCGYTYAEGVALHGAPPERHRVTESRRVWLWGVGIPLVAILLVSTIGIWGGLVLIVYPIQVIRLALLGNHPSRSNWWYALFLVIGKFPEAIGHLTYSYNKLAGKTAHLIEYK